MSSLKSSMRFFAYQVRNNGLGATLAKRGRLLADKPLIAWRNHRDVARDIRICGFSLDVNVISPYAESEGAIDTIHTPYGTLEVIFKGEKFSKDDAILDVGCGMGRPLAYLLDNGFPGLIEGVEINPPVAKEAMRWAERYPNVNVICGNALDLDLSRYTAYFMWVPMMTPVFREFIARVEEQAARPVTLYYLSDTHDGDWMDARPNWTLRRREWVHRVHGIPMHGAPERFSVWDYLPEQIQTTL